MSADRGRETRLDEAREEIARALWETDNGISPDVFTPEKIDDLWARAGSSTKQQLERLADAVLALPTLRAAGEGDRLRRDLAALAEDLDADSERAYQRSCGHRDEGSDGQYRAYEDAADRIRALLDGGKGGR